MLGPQMPQLGLCVVPMLQPVVRERKLPMPQLFIERGDAPGFFGKRREKRHGLRLALHSDPIHLDPLQRWITTGLARRLADQQV